MGDVFHDGMHSSGKPNLIFIVHRDADEELRLSCGPSNTLTQFVPLRDKVIRVAGDSCVSHVGELNLISARQETVENGWDLALEDELAVDELDFFPGHLRVADPATFLGAIRGWAVVTKRLAFLVNILWLVT